MSLEMSQLLLQLVLSTGLVLATVAIHGLGLALLALAVAGERHEERVRPVAPLSLRGAVFTLATVLALFVLHGFEIWSYAALYIVVSAFPQFEEALYFSTLGYAAIRLRRFEPARAMAAAGGDRGGQRGHPAGVVRPRSSSTC